MLEDGIVECVERGEDPCDPLIMELERKGRLKQLFWYQAGMRMSN